MLNTATFVFPWWSYEQEGDGVTRAGFQELLADVSCGVKTDQDFEAMVADVFGK